CLSAVPRSRTTALLCLHDALPILAGARLAWTDGNCGNTVCEYELQTLRLGARRPTTVTGTAAYTEAGGSEDGNLVGRGATIAFTDRKSTRLNSSHVAMSYAGRCLP